MNIPNVTDLYFKIFVHLTDMSGDKLTFTYTVYKWSSMLDFTNFLYTHGLKYEVIGVPKGEI